MNEQNANVQVFLLSDEKHLTIEEHEHRLRLSQILVEHVLPEVFENLSVFQPAVGCLNLCSFCSQESGAKIYLLDGTSIRTIVGAIRGAVHHLGIPFATCNRHYKPSVIFPYLDNDIGSYPYLIDYLISMNSLGLKTRISTVGWSRYNNQLNQMHQEIVNNYQHMLSGIRFSLTPYTIGYKTNPDEYIADFVESLKIYKPLLGLNGSSGACIDICCQPDIVTGDVVVRHIDGCMTVQCDEYLLIVRGSDSHSSATAIQLIGELNEMDKSFIKQVIKTWNSSGIRNGIIAEVGNFLPLSNEDGCYYAFVPQNARDSTDGIFYYLQTEKRNSGVLDARWPLRVMQNDEVVQLMQFSDCTEIEYACQKHIQNTAHYSSRRAEYLSKQLLVLVKKLSRIFSLVRLDPKLMFDHHFIRDRGIIRNSGRAYGEFRKIASKPNIMVVPDPVLSINDDSEVWRIFPTPSVPKIESDDYHMHKSVSSDSNISNTISNVTLAILAVDPPSHSNIDKNEKLRKSIYIPIEEFVQPLQIINFNQGKEQNLLPGVGVLNNHDK